MSELEPANIDFTELAKRIAESHSAPVRKANKAQRIDSWNGSLETLPPEKVTELTDASDNLVAGRFGSVISTGTPRELSHEEIVDLAHEIIDVNTVHEAMLSAKDRAKTLYFDHVNQTVGEGQDHTLDIPEVGKRMRRSGAGYADPDIDWDQLDEVLFENEYAEVTTNTYLITVNEGLYWHLLAKKLLDNVQVERHVEIDKAKLAGMIARDRDLEKRIRTIITKGKYRDGSFYFEDMPRDK